MSAFSFLRRFPVRVFSFVRPSFSPALASPAYSHRFISYSRSSRAPAADTAAPQESDPAAAADDDADADSVELDPLEAAHFFSSPEYREHIRLERRMRARGAPLSREEIERPESAEESAAIDAELSDVFDSLVAGTAMLGHSRAYMVSDPKLADISTELEEIIEKAKMEMAEKDQKESSEAKLDDDQAALEAAERLNMAQMQENQDSDEWQDDEQALSEVEDEDEAEMQADDVEADEMGVEENDALVAAESQHDEAETAAEDFSEFENPQGSSAEQMESELEEELIKLGRSMGVISEVDEQDQAEDESEEAQQEMETEEEDEPVDVEEYEDEDEADLPRSMRSSISDPLAMIEQLEEDGQIEVDELTDEDLNSQEYLPPQINKLTGEYAYEFIPVIRSQAEAARTSERHLDLHFERIQSTMQFLLDEKIRYKLFVQRQPRNLFEVEFPSLKPPQRPAMLFSEAGKLQFRTPVNMPSHLSPNHPLSPKRISLSKQWLTRVINLIAHELNQNAALSQYEKEKILKLAIKACRRAFDKMCKDKLHGFYRILPGPNAAPTPAPQVIKRGKVEANLARIKRLQATAKSIKEQLEGAKLRSESA